MQEAANMGKPKGPTYGQLAAKHDDYDAELWTSIGLLYRGGWEILKHASRFIEQAPSERGDYYRWRLKGTSYVNYFARLVGYLTGSLFTETLTVAPVKDADGQEPKLPDPGFYAGFASNADNVGTDFSQFMRLVLTDALVFRRALVQVELPLARTLPDGSPPATLAQEDALGNRRAYLVPLSVDSMYDWERAPDGSFRWCVLHRTVRERLSPFTDRKLYCHEFKVWWLAEGRARYSIFRTKPVSKDDEIKAEDELTPIATERVTSFAQIPICELDLPEALWVGNQAGPLCQEHYRRRSDLVGALCRSLVEIPYVKLGPEIPGVNEALPAERAQDPGRGDDVLARARQDGSIVLGSEDEIGFAGPSGRAFELADKQCKDVREEIFASVSAMALQLANTAAAVRRSGDSKAEDRGATAIILGFLATQTREFAQRVMALVSAARGEDIDWIATGLNTFDTEDRQQVIDDATQVDLLQIPSRRFTVEAKLKAAYAILPNATAKVKEEIRREIEANTYLNQDGHHGPHGPSADDYLSGRVSLPPKPSFPPEEELG